MKLADIVNRVIVDPRKLTDYALDPESQKLAQESPRLKPEDELRLDFFSYILCWRSMMRGGDPFRY